MKFLAGFFLLAGTLVSAASPLDEKVEAFEKAVKADPSSPTPADLPSLEKIADDGKYLPFAEGLVRQLMAGRSSNRVQQTGDALLQAMEEERLAEEQHFSTAADAVLIKAKGIVTEAKKPADLDQLLSELRSLTAPLNEAYDMDPVVMAKRTKIGSLQEFVLGWQEYLSASANGPTEEARQVLTRLIEGYRYNATDIFPRSQLLALRDGAPSSSGSASSDAEIQKAVDRVNDLLSKAKTLDDVFNAVNQIDSMRIRPIDLSDLKTLQKQRVDVAAGLPVTLDLRSSVSGKSYGDDISRIEALELLSILPHYLGLEATNPPHAGETVDTYLTRVAAEANAANNLALLQRALATEMGLIEAQNAQNSEGVQPVSEFLGGLSQEANGQFALAVMTYENALKTYSPLLPAPMVGNRLSAIKTAHAAEYAEAMVDSAPPAPPRAYPPGFPPGPPFGYQSPVYFPVRPQPVTELPIPLTISIPPAGATSAPAPDHH